MRSTLLTPVRALRPLGPLLIALAILAQPACAQSPAASSGSVPTPAQVEDWLGDPPPLREGLPGDLANLDDPDTRRVLAVVARANEAMGLPASSTRRLAEAILRTPSFGERLLELFRRYARGQVGPQVWNGVETDEFPYAVAVGRVGPDGFTVVGTGIVIAPNAVVTAAHVAANLRSSGGQVEVRFGPNAATSQAIATADPAAMVIHEHYAKQAPTEPSRNDIAVILLDEPVTWPRACLPGGEPSDADLYVVGYGQTKTNAAIDGKKRTAIAVAVEYPCASGQAYCCVPGADIVAGGWSKTGGDACQGDSGGPMVAGGPQSRLVVGMTIHGKCPDTTCPTEVGVYLRLKPYVPWLRSIEEIDWAEDGC